MLTTRCLRLRYHPFFLRLSWVVLRVPARRVPPRRVPRRRRAEPSAQRSREPGQQDHCLLPHKGLQPMGLKPGRDPQGGQLFLALLSVAGGGGQRGAHSSLGVALSLLQPGGWSCSSHPAQYSPFGCGNHRSVRSRREDPLLRSLC